MRLAELAIDQIDPPHDAHRVSFDEQEMRDLMDDIAVNGLRQPIEVRTRGERFEIIFGHRRWEAHRRLRRLTINALIFDTDDDTIVEQHRFAENLHRDNPSPMEEARAIERAITRLGITPENMARMLHRSPAWIEGRVALLTLQPDLQDALHARALSTGAALALADVDDQAHRAYLLEHAQRNGASIAVVRAWVSDYQQQKAAAGGASLPPPDPTKPPASAIVMLECFSCSTPYPHTELLIVRVCLNCNKEISR